MNHYVLSFCLLLVSVSTHAAPSLPIKPFAADYTVYGKGVELGGGTYYFDRCRSRSLSHAFRVKATGDCKRY